MELGDFMGGTRRLKRRKLKLFEEQKGLCFYCECQMTLDRDGCKKLPKNLATIEHFDDRYSPLRGTFNGECRTTLVCWECNNKSNQIRQSLLPVEELQKRSELGHLAKKHKNLVKQRMK